MKKLFTLLFVIAFTNNAFAQTSTDWTPADSARNVVKSGSGPGDATWNISTLPLMHDGFSYLTSSTLTAGGNNVMTDHAYYYAFNLAVPDTVVITGVEVIVSRIGCNSGTHSEDTISLAYNGIAIGDFVTDTMSAPDNITDTFGSSMDTWGNSLTPAIVNDNSFGVYFDTRSVGDCIIAVQDCRVKVHYQTATGINGIAEATTTKVYPNPADNFIKLETASNEDYVITDCLGRIMLTGKCLASDTTIDIENLPSGLYYIRSGNKVDKFIKK